MASTNVRYLTASASSDCTLILSAFDALSGITLLSIVPFIGIGLIVISIVIVYKRAAFVSSIFLIGCIAFSGVIFPIDVLPSYLHKLSYLLILSQ